MNIRKIIMALCLLCGTAFNHLTAAPVIMTSPEDYQVMYVSPNGKWACGVYLDYSLTTYAFRWNLESGNTEILSSEPAEAWSINDNGVVAGIFTDHEAFASGASILAPGYWDGSWHHVEMPEGLDAEDASHGGSISADGHYICGAVSVNGIYTPYIWKDGQIYRKLETNGQHGVAYAVSPDGQAATGWAYAAPKYNRTPCYWTPDGELILLSDQQGPFNAGRNFSPDGKKIVYFGGWKDNTDNIYAIYDIETGEKTTVPTLRPEAAFELASISNNSTCVGNESGRAYIYCNGQGYYIEDWLTLLGMDFSKVENGIYQNSDGSYAMQKALGISADDQVISIIYADGIGATRSMIVKMDASDMQSPVEVKAQQMQDLNAVQLSWSEPMGAKGIKGYNVYRDETKVNSALLSTLKYYDNNLTYGTHSYNVSAVYDEGEIKSQAISVNVAEKQVSAPQNLYVRQKGINSIYAEWEKPASNLITRNWYNTSLPNIMGFGVNVDNFTFETAVGFDKDDIANYAGCKIKEVSFYPMSEQSSWTLNFYTRAADGTLQLFASQPVTQKLTYQQRNTVTFDSPLALPDGDLIVAVEVTVSTASGEIIGSEMSYNVAGYSDLMRQSTEADFYSLYNRSVENGSPYFTSWIIDVVLSPEGAAADADAVKNYDIYVDGQKAGSTGETSFVVKNLADGTHTIGVDATFATGTSAKIENTQNVKTNYVAVNKVNVDAEGDTKLLASWSAPQDNDETVVTYASGSAVTGPKGLEATNWALKAGVKFTPKQLKGYDGYSIKSFSFYPIADAIFTFYLYENDRQVAEIEVDDYEPNQWNTVKLPGWIRLNAASTYLLVLDCFDVTPGWAPLAIDNTAPFVNYSDLASTDEEENWQSFSALGKKGNWMISMTMQDPNAQDAEVDGYDVRIDGVKMNDSRLTEPAFSHEFDAKDGQTHTINVDVYYPAKSESVPGGPVTFYIGVSAIDGASVAVLKMHGDNNRLCVEGDGVEQVTAYSMSGTTVASAKGNTIDISGLTSGVYIVKVKAAGKDVVRKIEIRK